MCARGGGWIIFVGGGEGRDVEEGYGEFAGF